MRELALFAGAGGGILGGHLLGWRTVCAVEWADYPRKVLLARQRDGILPRFPIWDDVQTFDGKPWKGRVDVVSGGFPCQDISAAGKGAGIDGARSGMWFHMARIVREVRPKFVFVENSPMLTSRGLGRVLGDLAGMGYDAEWGVLGGDAIACPQLRRRIWIFASLDKGGFLGDREKEIQRIARVPWWENHRRFEDIIDRPPIHSPRFCRVADGVANRVDRVAAAGNGQVPSLAAAAITALASRLHPAAKPSA